MRTTARQKRDQPRVQPRRRGASEGALEPEGPEGAEVLALTELGVRRTIALKEAEHRPLMREQFPDWEDRVEYWSIHDIDAAAPADALPLLEKRVLTLLQELREAR